jgi:membrane protein
MAAVGVYRNHRNMPVAFVASGIFLSTTWRAMPLAFLTTFRKAVTYAIFVSRRVVEDRCLMVAGSLTFTTLLALVPVFTVTVTLTSKLAVTRGLIQQLKNFVLANFVPSVSGKMVGTYVDQFAQNATRLTWIGLCIVVTTSIALLFTIENSFNQIWRTRRRRHLWHRLRWALALLVLGPFLVAASLSATVSLVRLTHVFEAAMPALDDTLFRAVPWLTATILLYIAYRWIPNRYVPARHAVCGALLAATLFEVVKHVFVIYVTKVPTYNVVYGAFASVPIFLIWLFVCWLVVLVGAEVSATLSYFRHPGLDRHSLPEEEARVRLLAALDAAGGPRTFDELRMAAPMPIDLAEDALHGLIESGLVAPAAGKPTRYARLSTES